MSLNASKVKSSGGDNKKFPILDAGSYPARVVWVLDLGLQEQRAFQGNEKPPRNDVFIQWELLDEFGLDDDGNEDKTAPRWQKDIFPMHNLSVDLAKSTKRAHAIDPDGEFGGDFTKYVGLPAMVTLTKSKPNNQGKVYNNVDGVTSMRPKEAAKAPPLVQDTKLLMLDDPDLDVFRSIPEWIQTIIKGGLEFEGSKLDKMLKGDVGGDVETPNLKPADSDDEEAW